MDLHHHSLCRLYGYNLTKGSAFMVMELAELGTLYEILKNKTKFGLVWKRRLEIAIDIIKGVNFLHHRKIIHRELKSLNILLRGDWSAFITDFGLAKIKASSSTLGTKGVGSAPWMAPEMMDSEKITTTAVDIFSFALVMYELLMREVPFAIEKLSAAQILTAIFQGKRPTIADETKYPSMKDCPKGYQELMQECWNQDPAKRPKGDQILDRLQAMLKEVGEREGSSQQGDIKEENLNSGTVPHVNSYLLTFSDIKSTNSQTHDVILTTTPPTKSEAPPVVKTPKEYEITVHHDLDWLGFTAAVQVRLITEGRTVAQSHMSRAEGMDSWRPRVRGKFGNGFAEQNDSHRFYAEDDQAARAMVFF